MGSGGADDAENAPPQARRLVREALYAQRGARDEREDRMAAHGINAHRWFYDLICALRRSRGARTILAGSACEQWVNGQIYAVIVAGLRGTRLTAYPEWNRRQHDCAVFRVDPAAGVAWNAPDAVVETKLVYSNYDTGKRRAYIRRILEQLEAESTATKRIGFVIGVYASWNPSGPDEPLKLFRARLGRIIRDECEAVGSSFRARIAKPTMETVLPERRVQVGAASAVVACVGQYVIIEKG